MKKSLSPLVIGLLAVAVLALSAYVFFQVFWKPPAEPAAPLPAPPPPVEAPAAEAPELPEVEESDPTIRTLVSQLSSHPEFAAWLVPDSLVERFVATVANVARGESPRTHVEHLAPERGALPRVRGARLYLSDASFRRYDPIAEVFTSLDTAAGVRLYHQLKPLFDQAYQDLGYPDGDFDVALARAIDELIATPIPRGDLEVVRDVTTYELSDPELEALTPAQKHFLRMGPDNMRKVQVKLRLMRAALNLPQ